jgi:5,10-methylenetetrahydrofolate reductase
MGQRREGDEPMDLKTKLAAGDFAILAEMEPPKGIDVSGMVASALAVKGDVDAFLVPEMSNAVMRMSALGAALLLQARGLATVMQVNCRDRNRIALQADVLAAAASGISAVMAVAGQDPSFGDHPQARAVNDLDLLGLLGALRKLAQGRDLADIELRGAPTLLVGSTVEAGAWGRSPEVELQEMNKKVEAGATFFVTPPIFDPETIAPFLKRVQGHSVGVKILPTVLLLKSLGMARYLARNVESVHVPDALIKRIQGAADKPRECVAIAAELVGTLRDAGVAGVVLSTMGWEDKLPDILRRI